MKTQSLSSSNNIPPYILYLFAIFGPLLLTLIICPVGIARADVQTTSQMTGNIVQPTQYNPTLQYTGGQITWPQITGASAVVIDPISNVTLYEKNADAVRPLASVSKLMTAAIVDDLLYSNPNLAKKPIKISQIIAVSDSAAADIQLKNGTNWLPEDLLKYMLIGSSNKAAENLASSLIPRSSFLSLMNHKAKEWNLTSTTFLNPSGLSIITKTVRNGVATTTATSGGQSTARQAATLMWNVIQTHTSLLDITGDESGLFASPKDSVNVANTDKLVASTSVSNLPIIFGKTGYTAEAGGNLAVVLQPTPNSHPHVIIVLGSTQDDRFTDVEKLAAVTPFIATSNNGFTLTDATSTTASATTTGSAGY